MLPNIITCENGWSNFSENLRVMHGDKIAGWNSIATQNLRNYINFARCWGPSYVGIFKLSASSQSIYRELNAVVYWRPWTDQKASTYNEGHLNHLIYHTNKSGTSKPRVTMLLRVAIHFTRVAKLCLRILLSGLVSQKWAVKVKLTEAFSIEYHSDTKFVWQELGVDALQAGHDLLRAVCAAAEPWRNFENGTD